MVKTLQFSPAWFVFREIANEDTLIQANVWVFYASMWGKWIKPTNSSCRRQAANTR